MCLGSCFRNSATKVLKFSEETEKISVADGLTPVFLDVFVPQTSRFEALSLRSRFFAYATSAADLYAATLCATTIFPRKARRDPIYGYECDAS